MDKKINEAGFAIIVLAVSAFFSYMYKWNKLIQNKGFQGKTKLERRLFLLTHSVVSGLIGAVAFYALDQFYPNFSMMLKLGLSAFVATLSDFIVPAAGSMIVSSTEIMKKGAGKWSK